MTSTAAILLALALVAAVADWIAADRELTALEYVAKPGVMVLLLGVALTLDIGPDAGAVRVLIVLAVLFSLGGDVFLMLPDRERWFIFGLGSFFLGHVCYVPAMLLIGPQVGPLVVGIGIVVGAAAIVGLRVLRAVKEHRPKLLVPVQAYMGVLGLMAATAIGTGAPAAVLGGILFFASDSLLAWNEFVAPYRLAKVAIHVTYHLAQVGLVLSLLAA